MKEIFTFVWMIAAIAIIVAPVIIIVKTIKQVNKQATMQSQTTQDVAKNNRINKYNKSRNSQYLYEENSYSTATNEAENKAGLKVLHSTLKETDHDDSAFIGSLGNVHDEGFDPCHEEQMKDMEVVCKPENEQINAGIKSFAYGSDGGGGFIGWNTKDIAQGFIVSEIINKKQ